METLIFIFQALLFSIEQNTGKKAAVDSRTGEIVFMIGEGQHMQIKPLNPNSPINVEFDMNPEFYIKSSDFAANYGNLRKISGKFADILRNFYGQFAESLRNNSGQFTELLQTNCGTTADNLQNGSGQNAESLRKIIGKNIIDREALSIHYTGDLKKVLEQIERLTDKIVKNTTKQKTIDRAAFNYDNAAKLLNDKPSTLMQDLRKIKDDLQTSRDKQEKRIMQNEQEAKQGGFKRGVLKVLIISGLLSIIIFGTYKLIRWNYGLNTPEILKENKREHTAPPQEPKNKTAKFTNTGIKKEYTGEEVFNLIIQYEVESDKDLSDWRKEQVRKAFFGKELTKKEAEELVTEIAEKQY